MTLVEKAFAALVRTDNAYKHTEMIIKVLFKLLYATCLTVLSGGADSTWIHGISTTRMRIVSH